MITGITHLHSALRWLILLFLILTIFKHFMGSRGNALYSSSDKRLALLTLIIAHLQLVAGLFLYFKKGYYKIGPETMSNATSRFWSVEHILGMLIAIILITIGYSSAKRISNDKRKFKKIFTFYLIALIIIIVSIPWPFRAGFEHLGWF